MITRKLSTTLLICIVQGVLAATLANAAVKVPSTRTTIKPPARIESALIRAKKPYKKLDVPARRATAPIPTKELDGRSAYINNQYIDDDEPLPKPYNDTSPPLYQFLQEQMEHILATSLPGEYQLQDNQAHMGTAEDDEDDEDGEDDKGTMVSEGYGVPAIQSNNKSPVFGYDAGNSETEDDLRQDAYDKVQEKEEENTFHVTMPTRPALELPKPISIAHSENLQSESPIATTSKSNSTVEPRPPTVIHGSQYNTTRSQTVAAPIQQHKPQVPTVDSYGSQQLLNYKSPINKDQTSSPSKLTYLHQNSTLHMRKRRITFKTISTSSQIISTPLADLLFKYSIGIAQPSLGAAGNSLQLPKVRNDKLNSLSYKKSSSVGYADRTSYGS